jgi:5-methyltetrahydrofolate--homocysteine methyltransferase
MSDIRFDDLVDVFREQAVGLIEGGVDLLLIETSQDILEVKAVILGIQAAFEKLARCCRSRPRSPWIRPGACCWARISPQHGRFLEEMGIDVIGLNCSTGPDYMREPIRYLTENSHLPVSCIPNAGLAAECGRRGGLPDGT